MPHDDDDIGHDEDWEPMEIEGGSPFKVKVKPDTFKVYTQGSDDKKLVCELQDTKLDIRRMLVSSLDAAPQFYSRKDCDLKLETYGWVAVKVNPRKVMITTPLTGWKKVDDGKVNLWVSTDASGEAPNVTVKRIDVAGEDPLDGYRKVKYWYKKFS